jgi:hypothetical protein
MSLRELGGKILCLIGEHALTSKIEEGIKPDLKDVTPDNLIESFAEFSALRCKRKGCSWNYRGKL